MSQTPTIGRIVHYRLSESDAAAIRTTPGWDSTRCNPLRPGQWYAAIVVATFGGSTVNLRVLLDGTVDFWATSRLFGDGPNQWIWPPRS